MMPAVKHLDPIVGVDIHLIITPPGPVVPIPHPHIGIVFDPFDYIPIIGSTVNVNGLPRAQAGTGGIELPPHFPIGGVFAKPPSNENEPFMGSATVAVDGEPFTHMTLPVLSCQDIGMPSPPRKRGPAAKTLLLPTSIALSIPAGPPVRVGGPPTISLMGMLMRMALGALLKGLLKLRKVQKAIRKLKDATDKLLQKLGNRSRDLFSDVLCFFTGHPVDVVTGRVVTYAVDWELPGSIPVTLKRNYSSSMSWRNSVLGWGWSHSLDLALWEEEGHVVYRAEDGREIEFNLSHLHRQQLPVGEQVYDPLNRLFLRRLGKSRWELESASGLRHEFGLTAQMDHQEVYRVLSTRNRAGHAILYEYDTSGRLLWVEDSVGRRIRFEYDSHGRLCRVALPHPTEPKWVTQNQYTYSPEGDLIAATDALGLSAHYIYQGHLLSTEADRTGLSFYFEYDDGTGPDARCTHTWGDHGIYDHRLVYNLQDHVTLVTNSLEQTTTYFANEWGLVEKVLDPLGGETLYEYNEVLRKVAETNALGHTTRYAYDAQGNRTRISYPDGATIELEYNRLNLPERAIDELGGKWSWRYDTHGCLVEQINPLGERNRYEYTKGLLSAIITPNNDRIILNYDSQNNLSLISYPSGTEVCFNHDRLGRLTHYRDEAHAEWHMGYDPLGREIRVVTPIGEHWNKQYDREGNLLEVSSPQRTIRLGYTGFHQLAFREEAGYRIEYRYDSEGRLIKVINEAGETCCYDLDARGHLSREEGFDGAAWRYQRDAAGQLTLLTHPSGQRDAFSYDTCGRLLEVRYGDGSFRRFKYRLDGKVVAAENEWGTISLERDALGSIVCEQQDSFQIVSHYAPNGQRVTVQSSLGAKQDILRDARGMVKTLSFTSDTFSQPWRVSIDRDAGQLTTAKRFPGGITSVEQHDLAGRPRARSLLVAGQSQSSCLYEWQGAEQISAIVDSTRGRTEYSHDERGRLTLAHLSDGRIEHRTMSATGSPFRTPGRQDRHYSKGGRLTDANGSYYLHDADGNTLQKKDPTGGSWHYEWNGAGLLTSVKRPDGSRVQFTHDALARLVRKTIIKTRPNGTEFIEHDVRLVWDGNVLLHELSSTEGTTTWLFDPEGLSPLGKEDPTGRYAIITDQIGAPVEMYDERGRAVWSMQLDLFGAAQVSTKYQRNPWRWPGQYAEDVSGLYYNRFRFYDPAVGRYISQDPLGPLGELSAYDYVPDPLLWSDPLGLLFGLYMFPEKGKQWYIGSSKDTDRRLGEHLRDSLREAFTSRSQATETAVDAFGATGRDANRILRLAEQEAIDAARNSGNILTNVNRAVDARKMDFYRALRAWYQGGQQGPKPRCK